MLARHARRWMGTSAELKRCMRLTDHETRCHAITVFKTQLKEKESEIKEANMKDCEAFAEKGISEDAVRKANKMYLSDERIEKCIDDLDELLQTKDHVGSLCSEWETENKVAIRRIRVPFGVVGLFYGSDPTLTVRSIGLFLKTGNVARLKGSSNIKHTDAAIISAAHKALEAAGLPSEAVLAAPSNSEAFLSSDALDLVISVGGTELQRFVKQHSLAPVIHHGPVVCSVYVHVDAEPIQVIRIIKNAKLQDPESHNAVDHILVHRDYPKLSELLDVLHEEGVDIVGSKSIKKVTDCRVGGRADWGVEQLAKKVSVRTVSALEEAIDEMNKHSTGHVDAIITKRDDIAEQFQQEVDSVLTFHNTSPRFADAEGMGMGPGIGLAANSFSCGPISSKELLAIRYNVTSIGRTRPISAVSSNPVVSFGRNSV